MHHRLPLVPILFSALALVALAAGAAGPLAVVEAFAGDPLENASAVVATRDGRFLYVAGHSAIAVYENDEPAGAARFLEAHFDGRRHPLYLTSSLVLSPDERFLYAVSPRSPGASITLFERDPADGTLSFRWSQARPSWSAAGAGDTAHLAISGDGRSLYLATTADRCLFVFDREPANGSLTHLQTREIAVRPPGRVFVAVSPDDRGVFALHGDRLTIYRRRGDGLLAEADQEHDGENGVLGMAAPTSIVPSTDGRHLYVLAPRGIGDDGTIVTFRFWDGRLRYRRTHRFEGALKGVTGGVVSTDGTFFYAALDAGESGLSGVVVLRRNATNGRLSFVERHGADVLSRGRSVVLAGERLYLGSFRARTLFPFERDAATGRLTALDDPLDPSGGSGLLRGAWDVAATADGAHVYVASKFSHALTVYESGGGSLRFAGTTNAAHHGVDALVGVRTVAASPTGDWVYAGGETSTIAVFERDPATGELRHASTRGFGGTESIATSADGRHVYVAGQDLGRLRGYEQVSSGDLERIAVPLAEAPGLGHLTRPRAVAVSADGSFVYVAGFFDCYTSGDRSDDFDSLAVFRRDDADGRLTLRGWFVLGGNDNDTLPPHLAVGPAGDGPVYLSRARANRLMAFTHDDRGGRLRRTQSFAHGKEGVRGLRQLREIAVDPSGERLYVAGRKADAIAVFARDPADGRLTYLGLTSEKDRDVSGLLRPMSLALSPDGSSLYTVGPRWSGITVLTPADGGTAP